MSDIDYANIKDWHGRPAYAKDKDGNWITKKYIDYKDCKKSGGNYNHLKSGKDRPFMVKDKVWVDGYSTLTGKRLLGWFIFDSFDSYDGSCYVADRPLRWVTWNVSMDCIYHPDSKEYNDYLDKNDTN